MPSTMFGIWTLRDIKIQSLPLRRQNRKISSGTINKLTDNYKECDNPLEIS